MLRRARDHGGEVLIVTGAAGMGKTALMDRVAQEANAEGFRVLRARGELLEQEFPWGVVRRLLGRIERQRGGAARLAEIALTGVDHDPGSLFSAQHGLHWLVSDLAAEGPLALLVDDGHWVDALSLRWLAYLAGRIADDPVFLAVASRPGTFAGDEGAWASLRDGARSAELGVLSEAATASLLQQFLSQPPDPEFANHCRELTGGNPLMLVELARGIERAGISPDAEGLRELRMASRGTLTPSLPLRIHRLGDAAVAAAHAIAVLGPSSTHSRIAAITGLSVAQVRIGLDRLAVDQLITTDPAIEFVHPLMRAAAYEDLGAPGRGTMHASAAQRLAYERVDADVVASHLLEAVPAGDQDTVDRLRAAARRAAGRAAHDTAARYLERALAEPPTGRRRHEVLTDLGRVQVGSAPAAAAAYFRQALGETAAPADQVAVQLGLAHSLAPLGAFAEAAMVLEEGLRRVPADQPQLRDELIAALLNTTRWDFRIRHRCRPFVDALKLRVAAGETLSPQLHANLAVELLAEGVDRDATIHHAQQAITGASGRVLDDIMWAGIVLTPLACAGEVEQALAFNAANIASQRRDGQKAALAVSLAGNGYLQLFCGNVTDALVDVDDALAIAEDPVSICFAVVFMAEAWILRDRVDLAWDLIASRGFLGPLPALWPFPWLRATRGWLRFLRGDGAGALEDLNLTGVQILGFGLHCPAVIPWRARVATVWAALGDRGRAQRLAELDLRLAQQWGEPKTLASALVVAARHADGDLTIELAEQSLGLANDSRLVLPRIDALQVLGASLRRRGERRRARELLAEAQHLAHETGAVAALPGIRDELLAAGGRPRRAALRGPDALTPAELRVARLAAEGRSNPEIAQLLFVTRRTVETHLTSAYGKLGIDGREALDGALSAAS